MQGTFSILLVCALVTTVEQLKCYESKFNDRAVITEKTCPAGLTYCQSTKKGNELPELECSNEGGCWSDVGCRDGLLGATVCCCQGEDLCIDKNGTTTQIRGSGGGSVGSGSLNSGNVLNVGMQCYTGPINEHHRNYAGGVRQPEGCAVTNDGYCVEEFVSGQTTSFRCSKDDECHSEGCRKLQYKDAFTELCCCKGTLSNSDGRLCGPNSAAAPRHGGAAALTLLLLGAATTVFAH